MIKSQKFARVRVGKMIGGSAIFVLLAGTSLFVAKTAFAAENAYLHIPGLDGSSKDAAHINWIGVSSVVAADLDGDAAADRESSAPSVSEITAAHANIGSQSSGSGAGKVAQQSANIGSQSSGAGAGKVAAPRDIATGQASGKRMHKPFVIMKTVDAASPKLMEACASGKHFATVNVDMMSGGAMKHYTLEDVVISSDKQSSGGDRPMESISFTYQKIEMK